jgi:Domain of unknown function (DUF222)/HNH endonuclease
MFDMTNFAKTVGEVRAGIADLADDGLLTLAAQLEAAGRMLTALGHDAVAGLVSRGDGTAHRPRLRDVLANELNISAADAGARIAAAADLGGGSPTLEHAAAASREGLIGAVASRIVRDTVAKLPAGAPAADVAYFDTELTAVAVGERPEVLRREAAKLLAAYDAARPDPQQRERSRAVRRGVALGPQQADGMSKLNGGSTRRHAPTSRRFWQGEAGHVQPGRSFPVVDGDPDPMAAATDLRTTRQRNHDALKASWRMSLASGDWGKHRGLPVTAIVTMTLQQLESAAGVVMTGGGSTVPVEVALRMAAHSHHYLYIDDENCGRELFLGRSQRLASADQRVVLTAIDGGCSVPGCDQPPYNCQVHHVIEWRRGGTTDIDRLTLMCEQNHKHAGEAENQWRARRRYDEQTLGQTVWYPAKSVDPKRRPRVNRHHKPVKPPPGEAA